MYLTLTNLILFCSNELEKILNFMKIPNFVVTTIWLFKKNERIEVRVFVEKYKLVLK